MREIKFRAWNGIKILDYCSQDTMGRLEVSWEGHDTKLELMQFTGLLDKNGKEIYEGDIVKAMAEERHFEQSCIGKIVYSNDVAYQVVRGGDYSGLSLAWGGWKSFEIIGNIYENKELLK